MKNNIRVAREAANISQKQIAIELHVSQPTVCDWEKGRKNPNAKNLRKLADLLGVSADYLLGSSSANDPRNHESEDLPLPSMPGSRWIPVLGNVVAGVPISAVQDILDYEEISPAQAAKGECFALKVKGDSMQPSICAGDVVIVRRQQNCESGYVAVILVNGEDATIKRIKKLPDGIMLIPNNPDFEPMFYSNEEIASLPLEILGKVIELRRSI